MNAVERIREAFEDLERNYVSLIDVSPDELVIVRRRHSTLPRLTLGDALRLVQQGDEAND